MSSISPVQSYFFHCEFLFSSSALETLLSYAAQMYMDGTCQKKLNSKYFWGKISAAPEYSVHRQTVTRLFSAELVVAPFSQSVSLEFALMKDLDFLH